MSGCLFCRERVREIDYKRVDLLRRVVKRDGTLEARRGSGLCRKHQTQLAVAVKRARIMALLPAARPAKVVEWPPRAKRKR
jgi:small subunit ribosomal protein S18